jgi:AraC-like DNA-binding protein
MVLRYVGRGTEHYKIGGRYYRVDDDQLMIAPQTLGSEVEIRKGELTETLGLCIFFPQLGDGSESLIDGPMKQALRKLDSPRRTLDEPARVAFEARAHIRETIGALHRQMDLVPGLKRATRFETVRRMNLARAYLHQVTNRAVPLDELARETAVSPFQLLRTFRDCFGETPASYHRRVRLSLARDLAEKEGLSYAFVADRFGFAGGASLSHAYRRTFGKSPVQDLRSRANS